MSSTYSQCGEDTIAAFLLGAMGVDMATLRYVDIGCHDPQNLNNTYAFYERGAQGVAIDANPLKAQRFKQARARDVVINAMVDAEPSPGAPFWVLAPDTLSTGNEAEAQRLLESKAVRLQQVVTVPRVSPRQVLAQFFDGRAPDLVSIDVEGADELIAQCFLASACKPTVFVVETLEYVPRGFGRKKQETIELFERSGYQLYADTYINSVFVNRDVFEARFNGGKGS